MGRFGGILASVRPDDMAAHVIAALVQRNEIPGDDVDDVYWGAANQAGEDNRNVARMAALLAGLPVEVPGATVNRLCGSGLESGRAPRSGSMRTSHRDRTPRSSSSLHCAPHSSRTAR